MKKDSQLALIRLKGYLLHAADKEFIPATILEKIQMPPLEKLAPADLKLLWKAIFSLMDEGKIEPFPPGCDPILFGCFRRRK